LPPVATAVGRSPVRAPPGRSDNDVWRPRPGLSRMPPSPLPYRPSTPSSATRPGAIAPRRSRRTARGSTATACRLALLALALAPSGCGGAAGGAPGEDESGRGATAQRPVPVAIAPATRGPIASYYRATATLEVEKQADVVARVQGIIETIEVEEGDDVESRAVLARIEPSEYRLRLDLAASKAANLQSKYDRARGLSADLLSIQEIETARSELATARAEEGLARLDLDYTEVRAPFAGRIVRRLVDVGRKVRVDEALFGLADFSVILARVHVPAKEYKKLQVDQNVRLVLDSNRRDLEGHVELVSPTIDPTTGTIKVTVQIREYPPGTRPGDFAEVQIVTERREDRVLVPKSAVLSDSGERVVFVAVDGTAERRVVTAGFTDDVWTEIESGLAEGEAVVVKGQRSLKHGRPIKVIEDANGSGAPAEDPDLAATAGS